MAKLKNNAYVVNHKDFDEKFLNALYEWYSGNRVNGFERVYVREPDEDDDDNYSLIQKGLKEKGFTEKDVVLIDNTW